MSKNYEVGYGKPPKHTRFKKGRSGNPKGRPKGHHNFKTDVVDTLSMPVSVKDQGRKKTVSTQQAALLRLREKALGGDARALDRLIDLASLHNDEEIADAAAAALMPSDKAILEGYAERLRRRAGAATTEDVAGRQSEEEDEDAWLR